MRRFTPNEKYARTFASEPNLDKAIKKRNLDDIPHVVHRFESGRVTALFYTSKGNFALFHGFPWIG